MLQSMTGFAVKELLLELDHGVTIPITLSIKSFNGRYFEASCKCAPMFFALETDIIKYLKKKIAVFPVT